MFQETLKIHDSTFGKTVRMEERGNWLNTKYGNEYWKLFPVWALAHLNYCADMENVKCMNV